MGHEEEMSDIAVQGKEVSAPTSSLRNQILASLSATVGGVGAGLALGYTSPAGPELQRSALQLGTSQVSLVGAAVPLGALLGALVCGWAMDRFGRRDTMAAVSVPAIAGWLLVAFAGTLGQLLAGRLLTGLAAGVATVAAPTYVGEVSEPRVRGALGAGFQLLLTFGIFLSYLIGKYATWSHLALASAALPVLWLLLALWTRRSPVWLLEKNREDEARRALVWLRGRRADVSDELRSLAEQVREAHKRRVTFRDLVSRENRRQFALSLMLMLLQQLSGINAVLFYTTGIFEDAGSSVAPELATIVVGLVIVLSTLVSVVLVDRLGRKVLLLTSDALMAVCLLALGVFFHLKDSGSADSLGWLPLASLMLYVFAFSIGFGPIPWLMMSELFAPEVKAVASGIAVCFNYSLAFLVTLTFAPLVTALTQAGAFWLFAGVCLLGVAYTAIACYETKGKTLQEIQQHFRDKEAVET
ncbi:facilitated trehalose transporter Tret1-like [Amphibalanus amphitrite]|uniref:facilitated trehalose transporter Tret1-like n=1 Tax=Amphibalanus amphitrite TaxID=1232801 RepID=UPI001C917A0E|nr:facilitated trehalose transporter Tret1-like [Amphibalanus amphitrite]